MILKLPLHELTAMARDVVAQHHYEAVGAVPAEGDSAYAELVVALNADLDSHGERLTIGVHRRSLWKVFVSRSSGDSNGAWRRHNDHPKLSVGGSTRPAFLNHFSALPADQVQSVRPSNRRL